MIKIEDVIFWILILAVIAVAIWFLFGSPTLEAGLVSVALFVASSEILLWKNLFKIDKRTALGFEKFKNKLENIETKLINIENLIRNINKKMKIK